MRVSRPFIAACLSALPFLAHPAAEEKPEAKGDAANKPEEKPAKVEDKVTEHTLETPAGRIDYRVTTGFLPLLLKEDGAKSAAQVFHVSYTRLPEAGAAERPVTFCFNGGPGSSSVWLHLGTFGPKRVALDPLGNPPTPPGRLIDNPQTLLDQTDLVFIDPVSTGFSRPEKGEDAKQFHGVRGDIEAVAEFIRLWLTRHHRWLSPKFLAGESYGTTRAAGLAEHLQSRHRIELNGLLLVSSVLDFTTILPHESNLLPHALFLPTYATVAWHHGKIPAGVAESRADLQAKAEAFALREYLPALARGGDLSAGERQALANRLAELTGLSAPRILEQNLHLSPSWFMQELLREESRIVGRMDGRYTAPAVQAFGRGEFFDPSLSAWMGPYTAAFHDYIRRDLGFESDLPYEILSPKVHPWKWDGQENRYLTFQGELRSVVIRNPSLAIFIASGDCDLATPYFATDYTFRQLSQPGVAPRLTHHRYPAGHMMYVHEDSLVRMREHLRAYYTETLRAVPPPRVDR
jgi:carboxypeptidase C (cathepsin A)